MAEDPLRVDLFDPEKWPEAIATCLRLTAALDSEEIEVYGRQLMEEVTSGLPWNDHGELLARFAILLNASACVAKTGAIIAFRHGRDSEADGEPDLLQIFRETEKALLAEGGTGAE